MPYPEHLAETMRADLGMMPGLHEQRMFGGVCFMLHGNMVGGVGPMGGLYRVGKGAMGEALALDGVAQMEMGGRKMGGFVRLELAAMDDSALRVRLLEMALAFVATLPPKEAKR